TTPLTATPQVDKVVLSRLIDITTDAAIDSGVLLERLIAQNPVMVGAIPFDPRQPSSLYIPQSWQSFSRQEKQASARRFTRSQSLNVVERQAIPEQTTFEQMVARAAAL
ncbi:hypothetical protein AAIH36_35105, partial [Pseudomonas aeruginosa]